MAPRQEVSNSNPCSGSDVPIALDSALNVSPSLLNTCFLSVTLLKILSTDITEKSEPPKSI